MQVEQVAIFNSPRTIEFANRHLAIVKEAIEACPDQLRKGTTGSLNQMLSTNLANSGWRLRVPLDANSHVYITALNDGAAALQLQTGNAVRAFYDLMKLEAAYRRGLSRIGFLIVPSNSAANRLSNNVANFERVNEELKILFSAQFICPLYLIAVS